MSLETYDFTLAYVNFHKPSKYSTSGSMYLIGKTTDGGTVKGDMRSPTVGETYRAYGEWKTSKGYAQPAFEFVSYEPIFDRSSDGQADYLTRKIVGLGRVKAQALVERFGEDTLAILRDTPERALEVQGVTEKSVESLRAEFAEQKIDPIAYAKVIELFRDFRISKKVVETILNDFGSDAPELLLKRPYILLDYPGIGWKTADAFALTKAQYEPDGLDRHAAAIVESLTQLATDGHTHARRLQVESVAAILLGRPLKSAAWTFVIGNSTVIQYDTGPNGEPATYALPKLANAERAIAMQIGMLMDEAKRFPIRLDVNGLNDDQALAAKMIEDYGVCILEGSPGTGKTYTLATVVNQLVAAGHQSIRAMAPTGKAAKRMAELLASRGGAEIECTTIHRALKPRPSEEGEGVSKGHAKSGRGRDEFSFGRGPDDPLDEEIIIIDEESMVDVRLGAALLNAIAPGSRVIFVGDPNQLPSVGPGSMLRDMLDAGVPSTKLNKIVRSDGGGSIVRACHAIKDGRVPTPSTSVSFPTENWVHIELSDPNEIAQQIVDLHASAKTFDPLWEMQVVTPQKSKLPIACDNLNRLLSAQLNRNARLQPGDDERSPSFTKGDKVIRIKNGTCDEMIPDEANISRKGWKWNGNTYRFNETYVVNGDMGECLDMIEDVEAKRIWVVVQFRNPDRLCRLEYASADLIPAFAITCHKAQGSGYPYVIVPVHPSFHWDNRTGTGLFSREWIYTAISRAERLLVTVGLFSSIRAAVGRKTIHQRQTKLASLITGLASGIDLDPARDIDSSHDLDSKYVGLADGEAGRMTAVPEHNFDFAGAV